MDPVSLTMPTTQNFTMCQLSGRDRSSEYLEMGIFEGKTGYLEGFNINKRREG